MSLKTPTLITPELLREMPLPWPDEGGDKEERGRVLVVGGGRETPGAVVLAGTAALRAGAGKLQVATGASNAAIVASSLPEATADMLAAVSRLLPGPGGIGRARAKGKESESALAPSVLTTLTEWAARRNNELREAEA